MKINAFETLSTYTLIVKCIDLINKIIYLKSICQLDVTNENVWKVFKWHFLWNRWNIYLLLYNISNREISHFPKF